MALTFCEICQNEVIDCEHLRMQAHKKACRDRAWNKVMGLKPRNPAREYCAAINEAYRPFPKTLAEFLQETAHYVDCVCGIRHEPPTCCEPGESLDDL
jgi:hypothetical protein